MDFSALIGPIITIVLAAVGGIIWLVRLEGRINTEKELRLALEQRLNGFESRISDTLYRIEAKLETKVNREDWTHG